MDDSVAGDEVARQDRGAVDGGSGADGERGAVSGRQRPGYELGGCQRTGGDVVGEQRFEDVVQVGLVVGLETVVRLGVVRPEVVLRLRGG